MKTITKLVLSICTIFLLLGQNILSKTHKVGKSHNKNKYTPKAVDLRNHMGAHNIGSPYGPITSYESHVEANPEIYSPHKYNLWKNISDQLEFKPYPGYENKLNPHFIKAGDFTNIAPSAEKIITPEITGPKLHVEAEINHAAHVKTPSFYGFRKEYHPITAYDKEEGRIIHDNVILTKPWYGWEDKVQNIKKHVDKFVNLNTGEEVLQNKALVAHGIERPEPEIKCHSHGLSKRRLR